MREYIGCLDRRVIVAEGDFENLLDWGPFDWGHRGLSVARLAFALITDAMGDSPHAATAASGLYRDFARDVLAKQSPLDGWQMTSESIMAWVEARRREMEFAAWALSKPEPPQ